MRPGGDARASQSELTGALPPLRCGEQARPNAHRQGGRHVCRAVAPARRHGTFHMLKVLRRAHAERVVEEGGAEVARGDVGLRGRLHLEAAVLGGVRVGVQRARHKVALLTAQLDHHWRGDVGVALLVGGVDERDEQLGHHALERHSHRLAVRPGYPAELHAILDHLVLQGADREHATLRSGHVQELELHRQDRGARPHVEKCDVGERAGIIRRRRGRKRHEFVTKFSRSSALRC